MDEEEREIRNWWFQYNWFRNILIPNQVYYVDDIPNSTYLSVYHYETDIKVDKKYLTKYMLCSERCCHKSHFGSYENNIFKCHRFDLESSHPLDYLKNSLNILLGDEN